VADALSRQPLPETGLDKDPAAKVSGLRDKG